MLITFSRSFTKDYAKLPNHIKDKTDRTILKMEKDLMYPSLHTKKIKGVKGVWEIRVDLCYRMTANIGNDEITLRRIGTHDVLREG